MPALDLGDLTATIERAAGHAWYATAYHGLRTPGYVVQLGMMAPRGTARLLASEIYTVGDSLLNGSTEVQTKRSRVVAGGPPMRGSSAGRVVSDRPGGCLGHRDSAFAQVGDH
jgi:hypothetical protein